MFGKQSHVDPSVSSGTSPTPKTQFSDSFTVAEFADMLGFPVGALVSIIEKNRIAIKKPFYNITELAERWDCSRATVYNVLRDSEYRTLHLASKRNQARDCWRIPASAVEQIERSRMERLPEVAA